MLHVDCRLLSHANTKYVSCLKWTMHAAPTIFNKIFFVWGNDLQHFLDSVHIWLCAAFGIESVSRHPMELKPNGRSLTIDWQYPETLDSEEVALPQYMQGKAKTHHIPAFIAAVGPNANEGIQL